MNMKDEERTDRTTSFWDNPEFSQEEFTIWTPLKDGTPEYIKILDWDNIKTKSFGKRVSEYIETDLGFLRIDAVRLKRQLKPLVGFKGLIVMQRWVNPENTRDTQYLLQKNSDAGELSKKKQVKL